MRLERMFNLSSILGIVTYQNTFSHIYFLLSRKQKIQVVLASWYWLLEYLETLGS